MRDLGYCEGKLTRRIYDFNLDNWDFCFISKGLVLDHLGSDFLSGIVLAVIDRI